MLLYLIILAADIIKAILFSNNLIQKSKPDDLKIWKIFYESAKTIFSILAYVIFIKEKKLARIVIC